MAVKEVAPDDGLNFTIIDSETTLSDMIDMLDGLPTSPPSLYVDLEGIKLSRHGTISILQFYVLPLDHTYLIDIYELKERAFSTNGNRSQSTLKTILEADNIPKVFFDVRNDSDALYHHFQISLSGVDDLQLMEVASGTFSRRNVNGLQRCIEMDCPMSFKEKSAWSATKQAGTSLFASEKGGRHEIFNERPLPEAIISYCVQDVKFLPRLWSHYKAKLTPTWEVKVQQESKARVSSSQRADYISHGRHKALAPQAWSSGAGGYRQNSLGWSPRHGMY